MNGTQVRLCLAVITLLLATVAGLYLSGYITLMWFKLSIPLEWNAWWRYWKARKLPQFKPFATTVKTISAIGFGAPLLSCMLLLFPVVPAQRGIDAPLARDEPMTTRAAPAMSRATRTHVREDALAPVRDEEPRTRAMPAAESTAIRSANDPRKHHAAHYAELKQRFPQLSKEHVAAATAAIHAAHIPPDKPLYEVNLLSNGMLRMLTDSPAHMTVRLDTTAPPPSIEQSITHVQTYDTRQAEMTQNYQAQMSHGHHGPTR